MKPKPLTPAEVVWRDDGTAWAPAFGDIYHPVQGAARQAREVFLRGNGLPARWRGREDFVILETGFGLGHNFLATWQAWADDPGRPRRLHYLAIEAHPASRADLARAHAQAPDPQRAAALRAAWPPATPDLHRLEFGLAGGPGLDSAQEAGVGDTLRLSLMLGDVEHGLRELQAQVDAIFLDGFAPARNPAMWSAAVFARLARLARPGATAATWSAARAVREGLSAAGFLVERAGGPEGKRDITVARYAPRFQAPPPAAWAPRLAASDAQGAPARTALIVGAGLAGCAAARSLARAGWSSTVLDAAEAPAQGASSNDAGLYHASFSAPDGLHAQWHRGGAAALQAWAAPRVDQGQLAGRTGGLLQLQAGLDAETAHRRLAQVGLPEAVVRWVDVDMARQLSGLALPSGGWCFGWGGWLAPREVAAAWLAPGQAAGRIAWQAQARVHCLRRVGAGWQALDAQGRVQAEAAIVVLANAHDAARLLGAVEGAVAGLSLPPLRFETSRGQVTRLGAHQGARPPHLPVSGAGYAIGLPGGDLLCGATSRSEAGNAEAGPAPPDDADHAANLRQALALGAIDPAWAVRWLGPAPASGEPKELHEPPVPFEPLAGRVGWRMTPPDRLPLVGPPVDLHAVARARDAGARLDAVRHLARCHDEAQGLYLLAGLGSRGLTSALLAGELLAHWITQQPCPVGTTLRDALDPARQWLRAGRQGLG